MREGALKIQRREIAKNGKRKENATFLQGMENAVMQMIPCVFHSLHFYASLARQ